MEVLKQTDFKFDGQKSVFHGKVRDVYNINDEYMVMVATDRISASFCPKEFPTRGRFSTRSRLSFWIRPKTLFQTGRSRYRIRW